MTVSPSWMNLRSVPSSMATGVVPRQEISSMEPKELLFGATDGAACHHVAGAQVAAVDGMVGQLLTQVPVHVAKVGAANDLA